MMFLVLAACSSNSGNDPLPQVAAPQFTLRHTAAGIDVSIKTATDGAKILIGIDDSVNLSAYAGLTTLKDKAVHRIYAKATKDGMADSGLSTTLAIPVGALIMAETQSCNASGGSELPGDDPPPPVPEITYYSAYVCNSGSECDKGGDSVWSAQWTSGNCKPTQLGIEITPNAAAGNTVGVVVGCSSTDLSRVNPPLEGQVGYYATGSPLSEQTISFDNAVLSVTPPMFSGDFFAGKAGGGIDQCSVQNGNCNANICTLSGDVTALALNQSNKTLVTGTSTGILGGYSIVNSGGCFEYCNLERNIDSIAVDCLGNIAATTSQGLWYYATSPAGNTTPILINAIEPATDMTNQVVYANGCLFFTNGSNLIYIYQVFDLNDYQAYFTCGASMTANLSTDGSNVYYNDASGNSGSDIFVFAIDNSGNWNCSVFADPSHSPGCSGFGAFPLGAIQYGAFDPYQMMSIPASMNLGNASPSTGQCSFPVLTLYNTAGNISFPQGAPSKYTTTCSGPMSECTVSFDPVSAPLTKTYQITDGATVLTLPVSCGLPAMYASVPSLSATAIGYTGGSCVFPQFTISEIRGLPLSVLPTGISLDCNTCPSSYQSGPLTETVTLTAPAGFSGIATISDGNSTLDMSVTCATPTNMTLSAYSMTQTANPQTGICNFSLNVYNSKGTVTMTPDFDPGSACSGPQNSCHMTWNQDDMTEQHETFVFSDGETSYTVSATCNPPQTASLSQIIYAGKPDPAKSMLP
jgi:hypothetical protein